MASKFNFIRSIVLLVQPLIGKFTLFSQIEDILTRKSNSELLPPIFIVGPPRTGSTLLFQILLQKYEFTYLNNLQALFYTSPATIARIFYELMLKSHHTKFQSQYGYIPGLFSPSEAGAVFRYWLGESDHSACIGQMHRQRIRNSAKYISNLFNAPFISKNLFNSLRIKTIHQVFPEAFFIWIIRDPLYASQSLIKMRRDLYGTDTVWASVKPDNYEKLILCDPFEQVVQQIKTINDYIEKELNQIGTSDYIKVQYQDLCSDPGHELERIASSYRTVRGRNLADKCTALVPLDGQNSRKLSESDWKKLQGAVNKVYQKCD